MNRLTLSLTLLLAGFCFNSMSYAAPQGVSVFLGGGIDYLAAAGLNNAQTAVTQVGPMSYSASINYSQKAATAYSGRGTLGYYFYRDPSKSYSFGIEGGYNYFWPVNSQFGTSLNISNIGRSFAVTTTEKTNTWSTDLEMVYNQDLFIPNASIILKLGAGYESMTSNITNTVTTLENALPASTTINNTGFGIAGGFGLQYNFTHIFGIRAELDGLKGLKNVGYAQGLMGLVFSFN